MELTQEFDDLQARALLDGGTSPEIQEALEHINTCLRRRFCFAIRGQFPGIKPEDIADAWQETLQAVDTAAKERRLDLERPLLPWLWKVLWNKAAGKLRGKVNHEKRLAQAAYLLEQSSRGEAWTRKSNEEKAEILEKVREAIRQLPQKQRTVIQLYVDHFDQIKNNMEDLRMIVSSETGCEETIAAVKGALREARRKVREVIGDGVQ
jgi:DNA-directed RNA polymerase specialized sigma24 family protein